jgi:hypothetical protein
MLLMPLATLLTFDLQVLMWCPKSLPLVNTASSAKVGFSQGNTWGVTSARSALPLTCTPSFSGPRYRSSRKARKTFGQKDFFRGKF